jgi:hypothetical protein
MKLTRMIIIMKKKEEGDAYSTTRNDADAMKMRSKNNNNNKVKRGACVDDESCDVLSLCSLLWLLDAVHTPPRDSGRNSNMTPLKGCEL